MDEYSLEETIYNNEWLIKNEDNLKDMFPEEWTHISNLNLAQIGFKLKVLGIDWRSHEELVTILVYCAKIKIIIEDNDYIVKRNTNSIFTDNSGALLC